jgi:hypothetical protein
MSELKVITDNKPRDVLYWWELTDKERAEFDYLDTEERQSEASFVRYKGWVYHLGDFERLPDHAPKTPEYETMRKWDGYQSDSFYSGVLVKYVEDFERVIMATYLV